MHNDKRDAVVSIPRIAAVLEFAQMLIRNSIRTDADHIPLGELLFSLLQCEHFINDDLCRIAIDLAFADENDNRIWTQEFDELLVRITPKDCFGASVVLLNLEDRKGVFPSIEFGAYVAQQTAHADCFAV